MKRQFTFRCLCICLAMSCSLLGKAQGWQWAKGGACQQYSSINAVVTSQVDNSEYVSGVFDGGHIKLDTLTISNPDSAFFHADGFLAKYDADGNVIWGKRIGGAGSDQISSLATDKWGNVYVAGVTQSGTINFGAYAVTYPSVIERYFLAKFDAGGNGIWVTAFAANSFHGVRVCTDDSGYIYLGGDFVDPTISIGSITLTNRGAENMFFARFDTSGQVMWAKSCGGIGTSNLNGITTDANGNGYICGTFDTLGLQIGTTTLVKHLGPYLGCVETYWAKFDRATGNIIWARQSHGNNSQTALSIKTDRIGNQYLCGYFNSTVATFGTVNLTNSGLAGTNDMFVAKSDTAGNIQWARKSSNNSSELASALTAKTPNRVVVAGYFKGKALWGNDTMFNTDPTETSYDVFVAAYDADGNLIGAATARGASTDYAASVDENASGSVFVGGYYTSPALTFGGYAVTNDSTYLPFLAKLGTDRLAVDNIMAKTEVKLYPNPATNCIHVEGSAGTSVSFRDITGRLVAHVVMCSTTETISLQDWTPGIYLVETTSLSGYKNCTKIVKE